MIQPRSAQVFRHKSQVPTDEIYTIYYESMTTFQGLKAYLAY